MDLNATFTGPDWAMRAIPTTPNAPHAPHARGEEDRASVSVASTGDPGRVAQMLGLRLDDPAGVLVTPETALGVAAVWRAATLISGTIGKLPLLTYRRKTEDSGLIARELIEAAPRSRMLRFRPNPEMTAADFWGAVMLSALQWGNGLAEIVRDPAGRAVALYPIHWSRVWLRRVDGRLRYTVYADDIAGMPPGTPSSVTLPPEDVLHIRGATQDGVLGLSVLQYARASLGLTIAADRYGARFFGNSGRPSGVIVHPGKLSQEAAERLRNSWGQNYGGEAAQGTAVLEEGMKYEKVGMPPEDAQFIQTRGVQVLEVARWYGVPPHKLYDLSKATFSNIEHQGSEFREDTIHPWAVRIEQEVNYKVYSGREDAGLYCRFDFDDLAVPSLAERADAYTKLRSAGMFNADELRSREGASPLPNGIGQVYWQPVNMAVIGRDGRPISTQTPEAAPGEDAGDPDGPEAPDADADPELPDINPDDEGDENRSLAWLEPVFGHAAERVAAREERAKAQSKAEDRGAWLAGWAEKHGQWVAEQVLPIVRAAMKARKTEDRDGLAADLARGIAAEWVADLTLETRAGDWIEKSVAAAMQAVEVAL